MRARAAAVATGEAALQSPLKSPAVSQNARVYMCMCTCACACVHTHVRRGGGGSVRASIVRHMPTHSYVLACAPCAHMPRGVTLCVLDQLPPRAHAHCAIVRISQCAMSTPVRHCCCPVAGSQPPRWHGVCVCVCVCARALECVCALDRCSLIIRNRHRNGLVRDIRVDACARQRRHVCPPQACPPSYSNQTNL